MAEIDTSAETIAQVCRNLTDDRSPTGYDRWFIASLLEALLAQRDAAVADLEDVDCDAILRHRLHIVTVDVRADKVE